MKIPKEVIELAISGGWEPLGADTHSRFKWRPETSIYRFWYKELLTEGEWFADFSKAEIALDPTFWQALGKSLRGEIKMHTYTKRIHAGKPELGSVTITRPNRYSFNWPKHAHEFLDLILQGKDTTAFWAEITANSK